MAVFSRRYLFRNTTRHCHGRIFGLYTTDSLKSATCLAKTKCLAASLKGSRYRFEKMGIAGSIANVSTGGAEGIGHGAERKTLKTDDRRQRSEE
jgi:hypothetical protein